MATLISDELSEAYHDLFDTFMETVEYGTANAAEYIFIAGKDVRKLTAIAKRIEVLICPPKDG
jgi:hypothetical protein